MTKAFFKSQPLKAFLVSRVLILFMILISAGSTTSVISAREGYNFNPLFQSSALDSIGALKRVLKSADAGWYLEIAKYGYSYGDSQEPQNWVFFPLYPVVIFVIEKVVGSYFWSAVLISNASFLLALFLLEKLALKLYSREVADLSVWLLAFYPTSYFFSAPFSESLYLCLMIAGFIAVLDKKIILSGILMAALTLCRPTGIFILPAYALLLLEKRHLRHYKGFIALMIAPLGLIGFMFYLWLHTGDMFSFANNQAAWGRNLTEVVKLFSTVFSIPPRLLGPWDFHLLSLLSGVLAIFAAIYLLLNKQWTFAVICLLPVAISLCTGFTLSLSRHVSVLFPVYFVLGQVCEKQSGGRAILTTFACLLGAMTIAYGLHVTAAMT